MLREGLIAGAARHGHWRGPVLPGSLFAGSHAALGWSRHGWIELADGRVCDPTRWVFEQVPPYIYIGPCDFYDIGGSHRFLDRGPPPVFNPERPAALEPLPEIVAWLGKPPYSFEQMFWLAHVPPAVLGDTARAIYTAINAVQIGLIPYDFRTLVLPETDKVNRALRAGVGARRGPPKSWRSDKEREWSNWAVRRDELREELAVEEDMELQARILNELDEVNEHMKELEAQLDNEKGKRKCRN